MAGDAGGCGGSAGTGGVGGTASGPSPRKKQDALPSKPKSKRREPAALEREREAEVLKQERESSGRVYTWPSSREREAEILKQERKVRRRWVVFGLCMAVLVWALGGYLRQIELDKETARREQALEQERKEGKVVSLPGGAEMAFVWIAPGVFQMGSPPNESGS